MSHRLAPVATCTTTAHHDDGRADVDVPDTTAKIVTDASAEQLRDDDRPDICLDDLDEGRPVRSLGHADRADLRVVEALTKRGQPA